MFGDKQKERLKSQLGLILIRLATRPTYDLTQDIEDIITFLEKEVDKADVPI